MDIAPRAAAGPAATPAPSSASQVRATPEQVLLCLEALHSVYEDFKLSTLTWPLLRPLGHTLACLASAFGCHAYWEHYARDLGASELRRAGAAEPPVEGGPNAKRLPADIHKALLGEQLSLGHLNSRH